MNDVLHRLWLWFWHLLPRNPILVRVVHGGSRRSRHLWLRTAYLSALFAVVLLSLIVSVTGQNASLTELAKGASQTFKWASMTQLLLMCFLAPVFTAGAITQERDAQTYNILLSTPLSNAQIVFGSLMSRLYFVIMLLLAGLPIFLMAMVYGGVTSSQILESFALSGSTAILTGALAIFLAMIGVGTRRTIFSFYLMIGLYLLSLYLLGQWAATWLEASPANIAGQRMSWLTPLQPFLALDVALNRIHAPSYGQLADRNALVRYALAYPSAAYVTWTTVTAFLLTMLSMVFARRGAKMGEMTFFGSLAGRLRLQGPGPRLRQPRTVWSNPVAWREAKTRVSGGSFLRWTIILAGVLGSAILFIRRLSGDLSDDEVRFWLAGMIIIQFAIALIIATNTAATSMTKEKESRSMDLLLTTPLTSRYILWGKLRGLVSFAAPLLAAPAGALLAFGLIGLFSKASPPAVGVEVVVQLAVLMIVYTACACVLGLQVSLRSRTNVAAVMYSIGLLILLCAVLSGIGFGIIGSVGGAFGAFFAPFTPFTAIQYLVNPADLFQSKADFLKGATDARVAALVGTALAAALYAFIVWSVYAGLVRGFDMTMRKQSST